MLGPRAGAGEVERDIDPRDRRPVDERAARTVAEVARLVRARLVVAGRLAGDRAVPQGDDGRLPGLRLFRARDHHERTCEK
jgi:hypothetical protein